MSDGQAERLAPRYERLHRLHRHFSLLGLGLVLGPWSVIGAMFQLRGTPWETAAGIGACCVMPMVMAVGVWFMVRASLV